MDLSTKCSNSLLDVYVVALEHKDDMVKLRPIIIQRSFISAALINHRRCLHDHLLRLLINQHVSKINYRYAHCQPTHFILS